MTGVLADAFLTALIATAYLAVGAWTALKHRKQITQGLTAVVLVWFWPLFWLAVAAWAALDGAVYVSSRLRAWRLARKRARAVRTIDRIKNRLNKTWWENEL